MPIPNMITILKNSDIFEKKKSLKNEGTGLDLDSPVWRELELRR